MKYWRKPLICAVIVLIFFKGDGTKQLRTVLTYEATVSSMQNKNELTHFIATTTIEFLPFIRC